MEFGRLDNIENVDFSLPPDPPGTTALFQKMEKQEHLHFYFGCTVWSNRDWIGKIYPSGAKPADFLTYYGRQFNSIELNTTHYRIPDAGTIQKWKSEVPDDFRFCPKLPQLVSHRKDLGMQSGYLLQFCESIQGLEEKLGCCFMQLPPHFSPQNYDILEKFLHSFPTHIPLALEFRHADWFADKNAFNRIFNLMEKLGISAVITDVAGRRDVAHMRLTTDTVFIRFVGDNMHPKDLERTDNWLEKIEEWHGKGLSTVYFFSHEPGYLKAPELSIYLLKGLSKRPYIKTRGPEWVRKPGNQGQLF